MYIPRWTLEQLIKRCYQCRDDICALSHPERCDNGDKSFSVDNCAFNGMKVAELILLMNYNCSVDIAASQAAFMISANQLNLGDIEMYHGL